MDRCIYILYARARVCVCTSGVAKISVAVGGGSRGVAVWVAVWVERGGGVVVPRYIYCVDERAG